MICNACSGADFRHFSIRGDGVEIKQCTYCGLGVVAQLPESTEGFYDDNYYVEGGSSGYEDYSFMAEHGLGWTGALVKLLCSQGRILDIGCADGYLLEKFGFEFEKFGIEVNAKAAKKAVGKGIQILGHDLLDPELVERHRSEFDVVTSIAVFEHLLDFRKGFEASVAMLKSDGFLLFEVPVMSPSGNNAAWMQSSFEHIYYPTEKSIRYVVETMLGCQLVGAELVIKDYASTYIGLVTRSPAQSSRVRGVFERLMAADFDGISIEEARAATHLHLLHAGQASVASVKSIVRLAGRDMTSPLVARIAQLWSFDLRRLESRVEQVERAEEAIQELGRLRAERDAAQQEVRLNAERCEAAQREARLNAERVTALSTRVSAAEARAAEREAYASDMVARLSSMEQSTAWRAAAVLRRASRRYPRLARRTAQLAKVIWWTANGTLGAHVREFRRRRAAPVPVVTANVQPDQPRRIPKVTLMTETCVSADLVASPDGLDWPADRPLVSVVIPCFNYGHLVSEAIRSVEEQTFRDLEIIVVEGGSSSAESREQLVEAVEKASSRVRLLVQDKPHRAGANRNFGISHANGKYICCLDADDRLAPTYIEKAVFVLENSGYDVVSPALQFFGDKSDVWVPHAQPTLNMLIEGNHVVTCAVYRKVLWAEAGGYRDSDPKTGHVHEDWLLWVRFAALGARFINIQEPLLHYRSHGNTLSNSQSVLDNDTQKVYVRQFNADVLTQEAIDRAERCDASPPSRSPQAFRYAGSHRSVSNFQGPTLLLAMPFLILGGAERLLSTIVANLSKCGWRVIIVTTVPVDQSHGDTTSWFENSTAEIFHLPRFLKSERWKDFVDYLFLTREINLLWIVGSSFLYDYLPALKLRYPRLKTADLLFNTIGHTENNRRYSYCIDLIFVENTEVRDWLIAAGESPNRICCIESGVNLEEYAPATEGPKSLEKLGIPIGTTVAGFFGRWSEEKDPIGFVEIAKHVPPQSKVTFIMTGAGPMEAALRAAISEAGFPVDRFLLLGSVPDIKPYLRACDILVLPSRLDGRPNVVMEALASGVAVVASRVGALPEMLDEACQGYLCVPGDYATFADRITALAADENRLERFKREARSLAERRLDIRVMLDVYEKKLRNIVQAG